jgi:hypothetical protein
LLYTGIVCTERRGLLGGVYCRIRQSLKGRNNDIILQRFSRLYMMGDINCNRFKRKITNLLVNSRGWRYFDSLGLLARYMTCKKQSKKLFINGRFLSF